MRHTEKFFTLKIGSNTFIDTSTIIQFKGKSLFRVYREEDDNTLGIDFEVFDKNGKQIAVFKHGRVVDGNLERYIITDSDSAYSVTERDSGKVIASVERGTGKAELNVIAEMYMPDGSLVRATHDKLTYGSFTLQDSTFSNNKTAVSID